MRAIFSRMEVHDDRDDGKERPMIDHVTANVADVERAKEFYSQALAPLGYSLQAEFPGAAGFGSGEGIPDFWIGSSGERGATHVAFTAPDRATVDAFHAAAIAAGAGDNGSPGVREHYHQNYYAAFVHDADGNNIEAVTHRPE
jgi:catechol 2,3-dioxygenase-like lactoylglutathione lyase family enzyme